MPSVELCHDGLFVRVTRDRGAGMVTLSVEDPESRFTANFPCHLDELLAVTHGMSYQAGNADGHLMISLDGDSICLNLGLTMDGGRSCQVDLREFERQMTELKSSQA